MNLRVLFVADFRSPLARNWISNLSRQGYELAVFSTRDVGYMQDDSVAVTCADDPWRRLHARATGRGNAKVYGTDRLDTPLRRLANRIPRGRPNKPQWRVGLELMSTALNRGKLRSVITGFQPDLIHALRIPFEGILTARAITAGPFAVSIWGNDLTLHASSNRLVARETRRVLGVVDGLHTDCKRDATLARQWGFRGQGPTLVAPSGGGVEIPVPSSSADQSDLNSVLGVPAGSRIVVNPRGVRRYVRTDVFLRALPLVYANHPDVYAVGVGLRGVPFAERLVAELDILPRTRLHPPLAQEDMARLFLRAEVSVSPSLHDGTPNSLLEAMAAGCVPVAGDIPSIREWICHRSNGVLCDPNDPRSVANAISFALSDSHVRTHGLKHNRALVASRASVSAVGRAVSSFYEQVVADSRSQRRAL